MSMTSEAPELPVAGTRAGRVDAVLATLRAQVDGASLALFRMAFGLVALWEVYRYFSKGWIDRYWVEPGFHFTYHGFGWVRPLPEPGMHVLWAVLGVAAAGIALGACYRLSCAVFALGFGYSFLLEATRYLNHFYLITLLAALLAIVPAHRLWSVDAWRRPALRADTVPAWALWLLRFQVALVYVYGGLAKFEPDWLRGEPLSTWLGESGRPWIGPVLAQDWVGPAAAWGALAFDLFIVPAVAWRRTRVVALIAAAVFHLVNNAMFQIGVFPYLGFAALLLWCDPGWPRAVWRWLRGGRWHTATARIAAQPLTGRRHRVVAPVLLGLAAVFVAAQLILPLRHLAYPGRSNWTEEGHTFAWHMKLRIKAGEARFTVVDPVSGSRTEVDPRAELAPWQYYKMTVRPEMLREYARHLAERAADRGTPGVEVYVLAEASLNGRPAQLLVDPTVDLAAQPRSLRSTPWIVPLRHPLPPR